MWMFALAMAFGDMGLDPSDVPLLKEVVYLPDSWGWSAAVEDSAGGRVRVWVHQDEKQAEARYRGELSDELAQAPQIALSVDEGTCHGDQRCLYRQETMVVEVYRPQGEVLGLAQVLVQRASPIASWPTALKVNREEGQLHVEGAWQRISVKGPRRFDSSTFLPKPAPVYLGTEDQRYGVPGGAEVTVIAWDRYGRGLQVTPPSLPAETSALDE